MRKLVTSAFAAIMLTGGISVSPVNVGMVEAKTCIFFCRKPVAVQRGQKVPVWEVLYCVVGKPGNYTRIGCKDRRALHRTPTGNMGVCFIGSDGKAHWDYQREVHVGRPFINRFTGGRWQPDWQSPPPY